jgi:proline iminopeptidase
MKDLIHRVRISKQGVIQVREYGNGEPLLVHAGGPGLDPRIYHRWGLASKHFRILEVIPRGTSQESEKHPQSYRLHAYAADLEYIRKYFRLSQVNLWGHSHGGFVATTYAAHHPHRVSRLILSHTASRRRHYQGVTRTWARLKRLEPHYSESYSSYRTFETLASKNAELSSAWLPFFRFYLKDGFKKTKHHQYFRHISKYRWYQKPYRYHLNHEYESFDISSLLSRIRAPTWIHTGAYDYFTPLAEARFMQEKIAGSRLSVFQKSAHFSFLEEPETFQDELKHFMETA